MSTQIEIASRTTGKIQMDALRYRYNIHHSKITVCRDESLSDSCSVQRRKCGTALLFQQI